MKNIRKIGVCGPFLPFFGTKHIDTNIDKFDVIIVAEPPILAAMAIVSAIHGKSSKDILLVTHTEALTIPQLIKVIPERELQIASLPLPNMATVEVSNFNDRGVIPSKYKAKHNHKRY